MNQKLIIPILMILTCSFLISGMYAGESQTIPLNITNPIYTVTGNSSNLNGLNITYSNGNATIHTSPLMKQDNFTIIFMNQEKEIVHKHHYHGGGSGGTNTEIKYKNKTITETIEVPYCNESCYNETQEDTNKTEEKDKSKNDTGKIVLWFLILIVLSVLLTRYIVKKKYSVVGRDNQTSERRNEEYGNKQETEEKEE